ncbi:MAG: pitrilysin family protein [Pyrinomonadaceae bacterium]
MKNKKVFQKVVFVALIVLILFSLVAPAMFSQNLPAPRQEKLLNGLKVLMWPDAKSDKVAVKIRIHSGSAFDPQGKEGVMQMLADNVFPNEATKDFFKEDLEGSLEITSNYDYIEISATGKADSFLSMLETLATAVANPTIDKEQTAKLRTALLAKVAAWEADPQYIADQAAVRRLFGTFPYGRPEDGSSGSLPKIDFADLIDAKLRFLTADNATIAMSGKFDRDLGFRAVRRYFGSWLKSDKKTPSTFRQPDEPSTTLLNVVSPKADVSAIRIAMRGTSRSDKDLAASMVFTSILESRLKARVPAIYLDQLFVRNEAHTLPGMIIIGFAAGKNEVGNANGKIEANELVGKALADAITDAEFQAAKSAFQANWTKRDVPSFWLDADTYKFTDVQGYARSADNVTIADVNAFAEKARKQPIVTVLLNTPPAK